MFLGSSGRLGSIAGVLLLLLSELEDVDPLLVVPLPLFWLGSDGPVPQLDSCRSDNNGSPLTERVPGGAPPGRISSLFAS